MSRLKLSCLARFSLIAHMLSTVTNIIFGHILRSHIIFHKNLFESCCLIVGKIVLIEQSCVPGGGILSIVSAYIGSGPSSTLHPKKLPGISSTQKEIFEILATPKNIPILYKYLNCIGISPKYSPIL